MRIKLRCLSAVAPILSSPRQPQGRRAEAAGHPRQSSCWNAHEGDGSVCRDRFHGEVRSNPEHSLSTLPSLPRPPDKRSSRARQALRDSLPGVFHRRDLPGCGQPCHASSRGGTGPGGGAKGTHVRQARGASGEGGHELRVLWRQRRAVLHHQRHPRLLWRAGRGQLCACV